MKKYNTYYEEAKEECWKMSDRKECRRGENWWNEDNISDGVNNMPIVANKTMVNNSEWVILHHMLVSLTINYINQHPMDNNGVENYSIEIDLKSGEWKTYLSDVEELKLNIPDSDIDYKYKTSYGVGDIEIQNSYDHLNQVIYFFISDFMRRHYDKLGIELTKMFFNIDGLSKSLGCDKWVSGTNSSMSLYHDRELIVCSM